MNSRNRFHIFQEKRLVFPSGNTFSQEIKQWKVQCLELRNKFNVFPYCWKVNSAKNQHSWIFPGYFLKRFSSTWNRQRHHQAAKEKKIWGNGKNLGFSGWGEGGSPPEISFKRATLLRRLFRREFMSRRFFATILREGERCRGKNPATAFLKETKSLGTNWEFSFPPDQKRRISSGGITVKHCGFPHFFGQPKNLWKSVLFLV